jgi:hypothetical protein
MIELGANVVGRLAALDSMATTVTMPGTLAVAPWNETSKSASQVSPAAAAAAKHLAHGCRLTNEEKFEGLASLEIWSCCRQLQRQRQSETTTPKHQCASMTRNQPTHTHTHTQQQQHTKSQDSSKRPTDSGTS